MTGVMEGLLRNFADPPTVARARPLERLARHSLFDRYMKAQLRLAGGRRKLGRNGFSSDRPLDIDDGSRPCMYDGDG